MLSFALLSVGLVASQFSARAAEPAVSMGIPLETAGFVRTLYLVRHGAYLDTPHGDEDVVDGLTPLGLAQARLVAARLRGIPVEFTSLTSSTMTRARQTATIIGQMFPTLTLQTTPLLRETLPRTWRADVVKDVAAADLDASEAQLNQAFARYFVPAKDRTENDIIVCHGNVIRYFVTKALGVDTKAWLGMTVAHCSLTIIQVTPKGTFRIYTVGDVGHIPPNLQSGYSKTNAELVVP